MDKFVVAIIGMGPRGLSILERIAALARGQLHGAIIELHIVDPKECGQGVHDTRQPSHLLINTIASQVTIFPSAQALDVDPDHLGPSLTEWARAAGYRRFESGFHAAAANDGEAITDLDYLPRRLLGEYLTSAYDRIVASLPDAIRVFHYRDRAIDMRRDGIRYAVQLRSDYVIAADFVFLTTGHGKNRPTADDEAASAFVQTHSRYNSKLAYIDNVYPVERLLEIGAGTTVAVQGFGLTAHDVISELTVGRGGRFERDGEQVRYLKSGREPHILLYSRHCLPFAARGVNQKGLTGQYQAQFFTKDAIQTLRAQALARGNAQLDFERDLLPLLMKDMGYVYRTTREGRKILPQSYTLGAEERAVIETLLHPLRDKSFYDFAAYKDFFRRYLIDDLEEAKKGNVVSAVKAATDVLRDVRESLRVSIEFGGLTPESHRTFLQEYAPIINRISFGPPKQRNIELLALLDAGVVDLAGGPGVKVAADRNESRFVLESQFVSGSERRHADAIVVARLDVFFPETDTSPFMCNLLRRGLVRPYYNGAYHPGGIDIDTDCHPVDANGERLKQVWAVGYLVEGPHYYTYALPRPGMNSRHVQDAQKCVLAMYAAIAARQPAPHAGDRKPEIPVHALAPATAHLPL